MNLLTFAVLGVAAVCFAIRLALGPSLPDRVIAMDGLIVTGVAAIAVRAMQTGNGAFLPVLVVLTLVGFVSTAATARFIEWRSIELREGDPTGLGGGRAADGPAADGPAAEEPGSES